MSDEIKEILNNPKILILSYGNYISLDDYAKLKDYIKDLQEDNEIKRLNNIINGLESWLKRLIEGFDDNVSEPIMHEQMVIRLVYDYLQILKGGEARDN